DEKIEPGLKFESADREVFRRWKISLVIPMLSRERSILGFFVLGEKLSGARFTIEDISLLSSVCTQSGLALERIAVERKLFLEQAESERLGELNRLKSYFVSSVSHDLKTPLTSIRLFAELLKDREDLPREKAAEYLGIIEGEADRLSRLITNVLDFVKIEKGTKEYHPLPLDLNSVVHQVMQLLEYQIRSNGFVVSVHLCAESLKILGDCDAIIDAITNLLTNAMKYSPADRRSIVIRTYVENDYAAVSIEDQGYGIPQAETQHIFEPFYQIDGQVMKSAGGAGLGLSLVKHTMDGHQGRVEVRSEPGKGSIFVLYFPIHSDEKDSHH
ncbi:MAG: HAMP domain-containing sensor histidine kinase, partial [Bacteroidota bacterium]|nr:HAMP domain-containing sensor histidine kinase [Bacteroidota bacterium]